MRFIIFGAGAVGGVVGGRLFENGSEVILIARGAHYEALSSKGLEIQTAERKLNLRVPVVADPRDIEYRDDDVVLLTMKSQDTVTAIAVLSRWRQVR